MENSRYTRFLNGVISAFLSVALVFVSSSKTTLKNLVTGQNSVAADSTESILSFISTLGWEVDSKPLEIREVVIPESFDDVYSDYNQIQISQGFDLQKYAGRSAKRWTFVIRNYPGTNPEDDYVRINILVCDKRIVGGDVCSVKLDGFMHGFSVGN
jgi:hypothetical protein